MSKFKVGDRVKIKRNCSNCIAGEIATLHFGCKRGLHKETLYAWGNHPSASCSCDSNWELITPSQPTKFKVGDEVRCFDCTVPSNEGMTGEIREIDLGGDKYPYLIYFYHRNNTYWAGRVELIEELKTNEAPASPKNIMSKVKTFIKNSFLSSEEKLLRKHGLKTECGEYTEEAKEAVINKLCTEQEAYLVELAKGLEAEAKESK